MKSLIIARNLKVPRNPKKYQAVPRNPKSPRNPRKNPRKIEIMEIIKQNKLLLTSLHQSVTKNQL